MVLVRLKGVKKVGKKLASGQRVEIHYAWVGGPVIWRSDRSDYARGSPEYLRAYERSHGIERQKASKGGRVRDVLCAFLDSSEFKVLSDSYQRDLRWAADQIDKKFGTAPRGLLDAPEFRARVRDWRKQFKSRDSDRAKQGLGKIIKWAIEEDLVKVNQILGLKNDYKANRNHLIWTDDEIEAFVARNPGPLADAVILTSETGLRPGDLVKLDDTNIKASGDGRYLRVETSKRNRWASVPLTDRAAAVIDRRPAGQTILLKSPCAAAWTARHLSREVKRGSRLAGVREELHFYDLRGSAVSRLVLAGIEITDLALVMGWKISTAAAMLDVYASLDPRRATLVQGKLESLRASGVRLESI